MFHVEHLAAGRHPFSFSQSISLEGVFILFHVEHRACSRSNQPTRKRSDLFHVEHLCVIAEEFAQQDDCST